MSLEQTNCCGLTEFYNFDNYRSAKDVVKSIIRGLLHPVNIWQQKDSIDEFPPFILFTDTKSTAGSKGEKLEKYIKINKLGTVKKTPYRINPNSGNKVQCYLWTINKTNLKAWNKKTT